jgi:hypothetical protein
MERRISVKRNVTQSVSLLERLYPVKWDFVFLTLIFVKPNSALVKNQSPAQEVSISSEGKDLHKRVTSMIPLAKNPLKSSGLLDLVSWYNFCPREDCFSARLINFQQNRERS